MDAENKILVEMVFGSHLYGTATPESDKDFKGVFVPSKRDLFLGRVPKSLNLSTKQSNTAKNTSDDVDKEFYSLQYFFELAKKGETVALDMLHAPKSAWVQSTYEWEYLVSKRSLFYTSNLSSLVGYARKQAAKYGVKGSRLSETRDVLTVLENNPDMRVNQLLGMLPTGEHCGLQPHGDDLVYHVCGRKLTLTSYAKHYVPMLQKFLMEYGERARQAERNEGVDWKAISHAFRAAYQVREILVNGGFEYPLKETEFLRKVKSGTLHFSREVSPVLDALMTEVELLSKTSFLPAKVDEEKADELLLDLVSSFHGDKG